MMHHLQRLTNMMRGSTLVHEEDKFACAHHPISYQIFCPGQGDICMQEPCNFFPSFRNTNVLPRAI